jgi:hypothetical protein
MTPNLPENPQMDEFVSTFKSAFYAWAEAQVGSTRRRIFIARAQDPAMRLSREGVFFDLEVEGEG